MTRVSGDVRHLLETAELTVRGQIVNASNLTTLVDVGGPDSGIHGIYKPEAGERPLWDFPTGTLHRREVAAFVVSEFLGWEVVPPTVVREDGPFGRGSLQLFVDHDPRRHYFVLVEEDVHDEQLSRMAAFDVLVNNADRKGSHVLLAADDHIWGCDHGLTFHPQPKLRTVIWDFAGMPLEPQWCADLERLSAAIDDASSGLSDALTGLLTQQEQAVLGLRAQAIVRLGALPDVGEEERPYPWPLL